MAKQVWRKSNKKRNSLDCFRDFNKYIQSEFIHSKMVQSKNQNKYEKHIITHNTKINISNLFENKEKILKKKIHFKKYIFLEFLFKFSVCIFFFIFVAFSVFFRVFFIIYNEFIQLLKLLYISHNTCCCM